MSELDGLKEELAYLKLWLGILIVTGISLIGWLLTNTRSASGFLWLCGLLAWLSIGFGCSMMHRRIKDKITRISEL